jgi:tellurite methyltransferase
MENSFWNKHYQRFSVQQSSAFSSYCITRYLKREDVVVELGCGNGRDGTMLAGVASLYAGIDACPVAIESFSKKIDQHQNIQRHNVELLQEDFTNIDFRRFAKNNERLAIYSRFSLHSINYEEVSRLLSNIERLDPSSWIFMLEARTIFDEFYGVGKELGKHEFKSDHYRRFIDPAEFLKEVSARFNVRYFEVADGFAKFGKENPIVMRVVIESKLR